MHNVYFATLGCAKNEVDTSVMQGILRKEDYRVITSPDEAEVIIVNTCGFIESAKEESIECILELAQLKAENLRFLLLTGCLAQRYPDELRAEIPEIDGIMGPGYAEKLNEYLDALYRGEASTWVEKLEAAYVEGVREATGRVSEYVKIAEGCNNRCSYCIIPSLRGRNRSRKIEDIVQEVAMLCAHGTREILLVAQNTTDYGIDLYGRYALADLLEALEEVENLHWVRLFYAYPDHIDERLIDVIGKSKKILPYLDIPIQHGSERILRLMGRRSRPEDLRILFQKLREKIPGIVLRSTVIVGFPGETEEDFEELLKFVNDLSLDRLGAFIFSKEEGTIAATLPNQVPENVAQERLSRLMALQQEISEEKLAIRIGDTLEVLIEGTIEDGLYEGRSVLDAPEIDGVVYVRSESPLALGSFVNVKITESMEHDLVGECL